MIAKTSGSGVCCTSEPRMLKVQATACGSDTTSASALSLPSSARMRASLSSAALAGKAQVVQLDRPERRRRAVVPDVRRSDRARSGRARRRRRRRPWRASRRPRRCAATGRSRCGRRRRGSARSSAPAAYRPGARSRTARDRPARAPAGCSGRRRTAAARSIRMIATPAEPVKPVSQASRFSDAGTYSF